MKITEQTYKSFDGKIYTYSVYKFETEEDISEFIRLFKEAKRIENSRLWKGSASRWLNSKVKLFGFYQSYPELFNAVASNNNTNPFQFYEISLRSG